MTQRLSIMRLQFPIGRTEVWGICAMPRHTYDLVDEAYWASMLPFCCSRGLGFKGPSIVQHVRLAGFAKCC